MNTSLRYNFKTKKRCVMKLTKRDFTVIIIQAVLFIGGILLLSIPIEPDTFKVGIVIDTATQSDEMVALSRYESRFNKYGGRDNTEIELDIVDSIKELGNDNVAIMNFRDKKILLNDGNTLDMKKGIETNHMNYRMSAVVNDALRHREPPPQDDTLALLKGLDIIISSLPERMGDLNSTRRYLNENVPAHHYFKNDLEYGEEVNVGIAMNKITNIDMENVTYTMDFFLWFRWDGDRSLDVDNIEFVNTVTPSFLIERNISNSSIIASSKIQSETINGENYVKYHVIANFKALERKNYALGEQNLPIRFRHHAKDLSVIHYVKDKTDCSKGIFSQNKATTAKEWEMLSFDLVEEPALTLHYTLSYSTFSKRIALGDPRDKRGSKLMSEFTTRYAVKNILFSVRGIEGYVNSFFPLGEGRIHLPSMIAFLLISLSLTLGLSSLRSKRILVHGWSHVVWGINLLIILAILLGSEFMLSELLFNARMSAWGVENMDMIDSTISHTETFIALLWWVIPAYYTTSAFDQFLWCPIEERTGSPVPRVLRLFVDILVYALAFIGILAYVFEVTTNSLMATSGAFAILFAVLSKVDISNIVAGLGISFAKLIKIDDWVRIDGVEGKVIELTSRSTKIETFDNTIIDIPNTSVGSATIENMGNAHRLMIHLEIVPTDYLFVEERLLEAINRVNGVMTNPRAFIAFLGQGDSAQIFEVYFFIGDYNSKGIMIDKAWRSVWSICERYGIEMSTPQREHFVKRLE